MSKPKYDINEVHKNVMRELHCAGRYRTVKEFREWLKNIPDDWLIWGYEGLMGQYVYEPTGISVKSPDHKNGDFFETGRH
jgi:hypothetical protein